MDSNFRDFLFEHNFSTSDLSEIEQYCIEKKIAKGTLLLKSKQRQDYVWFNRKGLFKYFYIDFEGNEKIKHFAIENEFILSISALLEDEESKFFIEALEESNIIEIPTKIVLSKIRMDDKWNNLFNEQLIKSLLKKEEREAELLLNNAEHRYLNFTKNYPDLANRLKIYEISAYLGINHAHLSRIRRKTLNK